MRGIHSVRFNDAGYTLITDQADRRVWHTPERDHVALHYSPRPPAVDADPADVEAIRRFARDTAYPVGRGLISADVLTVAGCAAIRIIVKAPQSPHGITYTGTLMLPFRDFAYTLEAEAVERGLTGLRESTILMDFFAGRVDWPTLPGWSGSTTPPAPLPEAGGLRWEPLPGFKGDPYGADIEAQVMWNPAEAEEYDARFPEHPLSRVRRLLRELEASLVVDEEVRTAAPFKGLAAESTHVPDEFASAFAERIAGMDDDSLLWTYVQVRCAPRQFRPGALATVSDEMRRRRLTPALLAAAASRLQQEASDAAVSAKSDGDVARLTILAMLGLLPLGRCIFELVHPGP